MFIINKTIEFFIFKIIKKSPHKLFSMMNNDEKM